MPLDIPAQFNLAAHFLDGPAREHPNRVAILGEPETVRYGELARRAGHVGAALAGAGCRPGDRVLIALPDSVEFIAAFFGATRIGAVAVPVNSMTRAADYASYLADSGAQVAIVHAATLAEFLPATAGVSLDLLVVVGASAETPVPARALSWSSWLESASDEAPAHPTAATDAAFFLYTSGSGGQPKAAVHQHKDMLATSRSFAEGVLGLRADDRTFSVSKLFFAYGLGNGMYFPFSVGASTLLNPERPRPEKVVEMVARHQPTVFFSVPTFYAAVLREVDRGLKADFSSVRMAVSAGEWLPPEILKKFKKRFGLEILDGIGSTEMLHMFISSRPGQVRPGSCGFEVPNCEARIVDETGNPVPDGKVGGLWVKGASAFAGYWNNPELTARVKQGEWVVTGDEFLRESGGYYHYLGRTDDMIKAAGMWVSPGEVENALLSHPLVAEVAVVGLRDAVGLTRPVAYVVLRPGAAGRPELAREIREHARAQLASFKCPSEVRFLDELPKTATGKIQRFRLRAAARA